MSRTGARNALYALLGERRGMFQLNFGPMTPLKFAYLTGVFFLVFEAADLMNVPLWEYHMRNVSQCLIIVSHV